MIDPIFTPAIMLRDYAWQVLKLNMPDVWNESEYGGMVPVVAAAEEPDLSQYTGPIIIYGYALSGTGLISDLNNGSITFAIYDTDNRRLNKTLMILKAAFERHDESARYVNNHTTAKAGSWIGLRFTNINIGFVEGGSPETTEAGRQSGLINIRFSYVADYNVQLPS